MRTLHDGGARTKPKSWKTVYEYSANVRSTLLVWAQHHEHLREISSVQVTAALATVPAGPAAARSPLRYELCSVLLHQSGRIFVNPTSRIPPAIPPAERELAFSLMTSMSDANTRDAVRKLLLDPSNAVDDGKISWAQNPSQDRRRGGRGRRD